MKKHILLTILACFLLATLSAQAPQAFKYQAVVRDSTGQILQNQPIGVRISIHDSIPGGPVIYQETFNKFTGEFGLVHLEIGTGTPTIGTFTGINWSINSKFIETEIDPSGRRSYVSMGTSELLSVPYALYSESSGNAVWEQSGGNAFYNNGNVGIGTSIPTNLLELSSAAPKLYFNRENSTTNLSGLYWRSTSDNFEGAFVRNNASGGFELYSDITGGTPRLMITNEGRIGIGTTNPIYRMHIEDFIHSGQVFKCDNNQSQAYLSYDKIGVFGCGVTTPFGDGGTGVRGWGSHYGVKGDASYQGVGERYGVYGSAANGEGGNYGVYGYAGGFQGAQYGVYGKASSGWGVYFSGGLAGSGSKSAVVKTEDGPKAVYCQESPENWFEDFGSATIINGMARIALAGDFLQTVTINNEHPAKVFITPNARLGDWWVEKGDTHFILYSPEAKDGSAFDYRIVAKRKGYEDLRLEIVEDAYTDTCLYPTIDEVPDQFKEAWLEVNQKKESVLLINLK